MALLELVDVHTYYGAIHALRGVSISVEEGEIVTLIGSNGAGKSTTLRTISGMLRPREGTITLGGKRIDQLRAHQIVELGVCQSPEGRRVFGRMTVQENLDMGAFSRRDALVKIAEDAARVYELFPRLKERISQKAGTLSGGEQQMLAIGRALMTNPRLLLLDEPLEGLAPIIAQELVRVIRALRAEAGMAVIVVEQHARVALSLTDDAIVLDRGKIVHRGPSRALLDAPDTLHRLLVASH
jgi:branched-chain amino acid transport system ATP-binding protein